MINVGILGNQQHNICLLNIFCMLQCLGCSPEDKDSQFIVIEVKYHCMP